jgi:transcriptional regulator of acetoin/glycerol metabolism
LDLAQRYRQIEIFKEQVLSGQTPETVPVATPIIHSWQRCTNEYRIREQQDCAPRDGEYQTRQRWEASPLHGAALPSLAHIAQLSDQGNLVVTLADHTGRLLWTHSSKALQAPMERCNAVPGGHWDEASVGTTSISLALASRRPATAFAGEHFLPLLREWTCYSAPILHPQSGELQGTVNVGTFWRNHTAVGEMAASSLAMDIANHLPRHLAKAELEIFALGESPQVRFRGKPLYLSPRLLEILCILAMSPAGMVLEACHAALYGDENVSVSTLKAELSHLRTLLDGRLSSRPYRLVGSVWADFRELWEAVGRQDMETARKWYRGKLLPHSVSPEISEWRHCITGVMAQANLGGGGAVGLVKV